MQEFPTCNALIPLLVVCGPTAAGKTRLSIDLAKELGGEVVSADSMQIYRRMDIGTAKPDESERQGVPHHLLDIVEPSETFSLSDYVTFAHRTIFSIHERRRLPILVGGTGLYIDTVADNLALGEVGIDPALRGELTRIASENGAQWLWEQLNAIDPELAEKLHPNNRGRIIRAIEVYRLSGVTMTELQRRSRQTSTPYNACFLGLSFRDRDALYRRIEARVDAMLDGGLLDEVRTLCGENLSPTAQQAIGYKEFFAYLDGTCSLGEAVADLKTATRRYAKRQLTWLRRNNRIHWLYHEDYPSYTQLYASAKTLAEQTLLHF